MFKKILLAVDDSSCAERAGRVAFDLTQKLSSQLVVLHVVTRPAAPFGLGTPQEELDRYAEELLEPWRALAREEGVAAQALYQHGEKVAETVVLVAGEYGCDLIVMGTHGREGLQRVFLGSVAERVSRLSRVPLLLVRGDGGVGPLGSGISRVLAPVDGSESGLGALKAADKLATLLGAELELLTVIPYIPPITYLDGTGIGSTAAVFNQEANEKAMQEEATAALEAAKRVAQAPNLKTEIVKADRQSVAQVIVDYARQQGADLIVVGSHGRTGLDRLLLGSVAEGVIHHAGVPVLLVRPEQTAEKAPQVKEQVMML